MPLLNEPIERRNVYELLAERLLADIAARRLRPGDTLPTERELTQTYAVGRSSVREALRILESQGLIRPAGKGAFAVADYINPLNHSLHLLLTLQQATLRELFEVRKIIECEAAALAAARRTEDDVQRMARATEAMEAGLGSQDAYITADLEFHLTIARATGNRVALHIMQAIRDLLQRALASIYHIPGSPQRSIAQHRAILEAIRAGDGASARDRMHEHLTRVQSDIDDVLTMPPAEAAAR